MGTDVHDDPQALVRRLRTRLGLTQEQFAQRVGVTYSTVNHWENGKRTPQPFLQRRLRALEAELDRGAGRPAARGMVPAGEPDAGTVDVSPDIDRMVRRIVERFAPERIILFGSHARGDARPDSDVDLLVVMPIDGSKRAAQLDVRRALRDIRVPKDVIVTSPGDFEWRRHVSGTVERPAADEGRVLYATG